MTRLHPFWILPQGAQWYQSMRPYKEGIKADARRKLSTVHRKWLRRSCCGVCHRWWRTPKGDTVVNQRETNVVSLNLIVTADTKLAWAVVPKHDWGWGGEGAD